MPSPSSSVSTLSPIERRAAWSLSIIYIFRMLGLFVILPVFSLFAVRYEHSTPFLAGMAIGIYGLLQACLQIPFGMLSDRIGRKRVVAFGLLLLCVGSVVAALADSIYWVIFGRALQGAGAIAAALMALAADLTRDQHRTRIMAMLGASIGLAFVLALMLGPILLTWFSIEMLFWLTAGCAVTGIVLLYTVVPDPTPSGYSADTGANLATMRRLMRNPQLLRLDFSIFVLHMMITATFVAVPLALHSAGLDDAKHWTLYLPAMGLSLVVMVPLIMLAERRTMRGILLLSVAGLGLSQLMFGWLPVTPLWLFVGIIVFFSFLNALEALLPSLVSRLAPAAAKGSAMGIYSSSQFIGAFVGGAGGGWLLGAYGAKVLFSALSGLAIVWVGVLSGFIAPRPMITHRRPLTEDEQARSTDVSAELLALPGVEEVVMALDEGVAYMKVDKTRFKQPV